METEKLLEDAARVIEGADGSLDVDEATLGRIISGARDVGNGLFKNRRYEEAIQKYSEAISGCQLRRKLRAEGRSGFVSQRPRTACEEKEESLEETKMYSNRSAALLHSGRAEEAARDAAHCVERSKGWSKGYFRLGSALDALDRRREATLALKAGLAIDPSSQDLLDKFNMISSELSEMQERSKRETGFVRRDLVLQLRDARREDRRAEMLNQLKQGMSAPEWDIDDYEWRPTFLPAMRRRRITHVEGSNSPVHEYVLNLINSTGELEHPKRVLDILGDGERLRAYDVAIGKCLSECEGKSSQIPTVLTVGAGSGILAMMCARRGASHIYCSDRSRLLQRMAKQDIESNLSEYESTHFTLISKPLVECTASVMDDDHSGTVERAAAAETSGSVDADGTSYPSQLKSSPDLPTSVGLVVTDCFNHAGIGWGILNSLDHAARSGVLDKGVQILPKRVTVHAQMMEFRLSSVSGIDLSYMNAYRWHPGVDRVDLRRMLAEKHESYRALSKPFVVQEIDIQGRVNDFLEGTFQAKEGISMFAIEKEMDIEVKTSGTWNAIALWFELDLGEGIALISYNHDGEEYSTHEKDETYIASSFGQGVFYIDELPVTTGDTALIQIQHDGQHFSFESDPPSSRARHAYIPHWHYDMILDDARNDAYERALRATVQRKRDFGHSEELLALDLGAGSGLLSMLAARAGVDRVIGCEISRHMCDVGEECEVMNGYAGKCLLLNKDARQMESKTKADGSLPDIDRLADLLVFEVFDSGLIGEGALHILASAREKLLKEDATIIPCAATVYAQPIQMRIEQADGVGFDFRHANRYKWRPDYEGLEMGKMRDKWIALADPVQVFSFDFYKHKANMQPALETLKFGINRSGICNAIMFWFDLFLDEEDTTLSTCPYSTEKGPTWQQAIQWVEEVEVAENVSLPVTAQHDTFGISFSINNADIDRFALRTGVPLFDPLWRSQYDKLASVNSRIMRASAQNPLEFRKLAEAAVAIGSRPGHYCAEPHAAVEFLKRIMS